MRLSFTLQLPTILLVAGKKKERGMIYYLKPLVSKDIPGNEIGNEAFNF